jgi:hypothetical protein
VKLHVDLVASSSSLLTLTHLYISHQIHPSLVNLHHQVRMNALPVRVEEFVGQAGFLIEEEHDAKVGLLV